MRNLSFFLYYCTDRARLQNRKPRFVVRNRVRGMAERLGRKMEIEHAFRGIACYRGFFPYFSRNSCHKITKNHTVPRDSKKGVLASKNGGGGGSRTRDLLFRREPLYPTELRHRSRVFLSRGTRKQLSDERPEVRGRAGAACGRRLSGCDETSEHHNTIAQFRRKSSAAWLVDLF